MFCKNIKTCKVPKRLIFVKGEYKILECERCEFRYSKINVPLEKHLEKVYGDDYFLGGKDGYPDYFEEETNIIKQGEYYANIISKYTTPGKMIDIGAAAGFLMQGFSNKKWDVFGIEPNKTMTDYGIRELNLKIINDSFENFDFKGTYDLVTLIQVIGHFYDLNIAMDKLSSLVLPGGYVLVESWDMKSLYARVLGKNWHEYSPPSVLNWFSKSSITNCFEQYGFTNIETGSPQKKISLNHAMTLIEYKYPGLKFATHFIDKIKGEKDIHIAYPALDIFWCIFKKK